MHPEGPGVKVGCLLIGDRKGIWCGRIRGLLQERKAATEEVFSCSGNLEQALEKFGRIRRCEAACVAAEGPFWSIALALAIRLNVDRIILLMPEKTECCRGDAAEQQLYRYVHRNLFFCVSEVLIVENNNREACVSDDISALCRQMINSHIWRMRMPDMQKDGDVFLDTLARFLLDGARALETEERI